MSAFFKWLEIWIEDFIVNVFHDPLAQHPSELSMNQDPVQPNTPPITLNSAPSATPAPTKGEILYDAARTAIGQKIAPADIEEVGCAFCVNAIWKRCFGREICPPPNNTSTFWLYKTLKVGAFDLVTVPQAGDICISPTNLGGNNGITNGHVGIVGKNIAPNGTLWIMSNNSPTGTWEANYTVRGWHDHFVVKGGYPQLYFRPV